MWKKVVCYNFAWEKTTTKNNKQKKKKKKKNVSSIECRICSKLTIVADDILDFFFSEKNVVSSAAVVTGILWVKSDSNNEYTVA